MRLEDYMIDINTRSLDSMHKFVYAMISHTADLFNFRYFSIFKMQFAFFWLISLQNSNLPINLVLKVINYLF